MEPAGALPGAEGAVGVGGPTPGADGVPPAARAPPFAVGGVLVGAPGALGTGGATVDRRAAPLEVGVLVATGRAAPREEAVSRAARAPALGPGGAPAPPAPLDATRVELGSVIINVMVTRDEDVTRRNWSFIGKSFGALGIVYLATAIISVLSALKVVIPPRALSDEVGTWVLYIIGSTIPWAVTAIMGFFRKNNRVKVALPYMCFITNNMTAVAFSTKLLDRVAVRGALLMPLMVGILACFSALAARKNYSVEPVKLVLVAFSALAMLLKADKFVIEFFYLQSEADMVAKATYVQVLTLILFHIYDAFLWNGQHAKKAVKDWYIFGSMGKRRAVSTVLGLVIGTTWF